MSNMNDIKTKLSGQRAAVREHVEKYRRYPHEEDKQFALKTIRNAQNQIAALKRKATAKIESSWEDDWRP